MLPPRKFLMKNSIYKDLEEQIKGILGTKVSINPKNEKSGKLEIEYYSQDELDRIIDLIRTIQLSSN